MTTSSLLSLETTKDEARVGEYAYEARDEEISTNEVVFRPGEFMAPHFCGLHPELE